MSSVQPFQFEPEQRINEVMNTDDECVHEEERHESRVGQSQWCLCGNCVSMGTERESLCCQELQFLTDVQRK